MAQTRLIRLIEVITTGWGRSQPQWGHLWIGGDIVDLCEEFPREQYPFDRVESDNGFSVTEFRFEELAPLEGFEGTEGAWYAGCTPPEGTPHVPCDWVQIDDPRTLPARPDWRVALPACAWLW